MAGTFEIFKDKKGEFRFRLKAGNGETILASEGYGDRAGARAGIAAVKKNAGEVGRYVKKASANNRVIGQSEMYDGEPACDAGIRSVMRHALGAKVEDLAA